MDTPYEIENYIVYFEDIPYDEIPKNFKRFCDDEILRHLNSLNMERKFDEDFNKRYTKRSAFFQEYANEHIYTCKWNKILHRIEVSFKWRKRVF